jgi:hypothetical protein
MIRPLIVLAALASFSAHAADDFICDLAIRHDAKPVGTISLSQAYGVSTKERLYTVPVSVKQDESGRTVETVEITLDGTIRNDGTDGSSIDATLNLITTRDRKIPTGTRHSVEKEVLGKIQGQDPVKVSLAAAGYSIDGSCEVYLGE